VFTIVNKRGLLPADTTHRQAAPRSGTSKPESREPGSNYLGSAIRSWAMIAMTEPFPASRARLAAREA
jgi:hypothetical protein